MIKFVMGFMSVVATLQFIGCSGSEDQDLSNISEDLSPKVSETAKTPAVDLSEVEEPIVESKPATIPLHKADPKPVRVDASSVPFRLSALFSGGGYGARAGLVSRKDGTAMVASVDDTFLEYQIKEINYASGEVIVSHKGQLLVISQSGAESITERTVVVNRGKGSETDLLKIKGPMFEPTPEEVDFGIDPNNGDTWPDYYRGPEIERLLRNSEGEDYQLGETEVDEMDEESKLALGIEDDEEPKQTLTEEEAFPGISTKKQFEPTGKEYMRGIDPNDPNTWPEDYMGPGIERALETKNGI